MKNLLILLFLIASVCTKSQTNEYISNVCRALDINVFTKVDPPYIYTNRVALNKVLLSNIDIEYINVPDNVKTAVQKAVDIWRYLLFSSVTIKIRIKWETFGDPTILGESGPFKEFTLTSDPNKYYPVALANMIEGIDLDPDNPDMEITLNKNANWYYLTDGNTLAETYDLVSVLMHEIAHGLGFTDSYNVDSETQSGSFGVEESKPTVYDSYIGKNGISLTTYTNPSYSLYNELVGNSLTFIGPQSSELNGGESPKIYAPKPWENGSSISHFDQDYYKFGNPNSLMTPFRGKAESVHSPGNVGLAVLDDIGWSVAGLITVVSPSNNTVWTKGNTYNITFTSNFEGSVRIELHKKLSDGTYIYNETLATAFNCIIGVNILPWAVPTAKANGQYKIIAKNYGESMGFFNITNINQVSGPEISQPTGTYRGSMSYTITCPDPNAIIRYEFGYPDNPPPDPTETSARWDWNPGTGQYRTVSYPTADVIVKARTYRTNYFPSDVIKVTYHLVPGLKIKQLDESSSIFDKAAYWNYGSWKDAGPDEILIQDLGINYFRADDIKTSTTQKFNLWEDNLPQTGNWYRNWEEINISENTSELRAKFKTAYNATLNNYIDGNSYGIAGGIIFFKDPWLIDQNVQPYGNRNRGTNAQLMPLPSSTSIGTNTNYKGVFLSQRPEIEGIFYSVKAPLLQNFNSSQTGLNHILYFQNWSVSPANSATFLQNGSNPGGFDEKAIVFNASATVIANYKATQISNNTAAYSNNSQRKLVRTKDNWLHQVYESMGRVWLEHSTNNGTSWFLGNQDQPLDNGAGKCPSIDWLYDQFHNYHSLVVAFQQQNGTTYTIQYTTFKNVNGTYINMSSAPLKSKLLYTVTTDPYTTNANPNISWGKNQNANMGNFVLTFERKNVSAAGIYWIYGIMDELGIISPHTHQPYNYPCNGDNIHIAGPVYVNGTNNNSINASVNLNKMNITSHFDIVYQQYVSSNSNSIKDVVLACNLGNPSGEWRWIPWQSPTTTTLSSSTGVSNYKPSMVQMPNDDIRVCWIRSLNGDPINSPYSVHVIYWNSAVYPWQFASYGFRTQSVSINLRDDNAKSFYLFSQYGMNNQWENYISNGSSYVKLSTAGKDVQLSNGPLVGTNSKMFTSVFYPFTQPYYFKTAGYIDQKVQKTTADEQITYGRGVVLEKGNIEFYYSLKSVNVDDSNIKFIDIPENKPDTLKTILQQRLDEGNRYFNIEGLNKILLTEPFTVNTNSNIFLIEQAGFTDTLAAKKEMGSNFIMYKLELIDDVTNKVIGSIKESKFTSNILPKSELLSSKLNLGKIGEKIVRLKLMLKSNIEDLKGVLINEFGNIDENIIAKLAFNDLVLNGSEIITEYAIEQNYPNPFNPTTIIKYQIPKDGIVTLKIYDVLGNEVKTLVNEYKGIGRYEVKFDASALASGVYIYRIMANDFISSKKMLFLK